ncbi:MAG TPA: hypothetical protein VE075_09840, partial [Thermoanaerobaculia bacterium]|nr:hypothetical protein [Thermoanaerobaculia bacterium]
MPRLRPAIHALLAAAALAAFTGRPATPAAARPAAGAPPGGGAAGGGSGAGVETVDLDVVTRIRDEGFHRSQALATAAYLADRIGSRLTGTPELKEANEWTRRRLAGWGLANAHLEAWRFGRGWSFSRAVVAMAPVSGTSWLQLSALPKAWTPGTPGEVRGEAVRVTLDSAADLDRYRGKLAGKVVLLDQARDLAELAAAEPRRFTAEKLAELAAFSANAGPSTADREKRRERYRWREQVRKFLVAERALASIEASPLPWGLIRVTGGGPYKDGDAPAVTG